MTFPTAARRGCSSPYLRATVQLGIFEGLSAMTKRKRAAALDAALAAMFRSLEERRVPEHIERTIDGLEGAHEDEERAPQRKRA